MEKPIFYVGKPRPASWTEPTLPSPTPPVIIDTTKQTTKKDFSSRGEKPRSKSVLLPGSPPEIAYAPPSQSRQTFYEGRSSGPFNNAIGTELKKTVRMDESTENTRRVVTVEQTSRVIKYGENQTDNSYGTSMGHQQQHQSSFNVPVPKKFIQGQFRESDYESDIDAGRIRPKWTPAESDTDEPRYRKVQPPRSSRPRSIDASQSSPIVTWPSESENERSETEMRSSFSKQKLNEQILKPGSPPEFGYASGKEFRQTANRKGALDIIFYFIFFSIASIIHASRRTVQQLPFSNPFKNVSQSRYLCTLFLILFVLSYSIYLVLKSPHSRTTCTWNISNPQT